MAENFKAATGEAPFRPRAPWWGGDLQTMRNFLVVEWKGIDTGDLAVRRLDLPMRDGSGDRLVGEFSPGREDRPLILLIHGLTGCATSSYMVFSARHFRRLGYPVLRLSMRGAGPSRAVSRSTYHAGLSEDIADALAAIRDRVGPEGVVPVGYSLGGNILCRYLARQVSSDVRAAVIVSAPIDLKATARRFMESRNLLYHRWLLGRMKQDILGTTLTDEEKAAVRTARTVYEFDDYFVAPRFGFGDAETYYRRCAGMRLLPDINIPTLVIHARNDPWIPFEPYAAFDWQSNPHVTPLLPPGGGHVGFHQVGDNVAWHDRMIERFLTEVVV